MKSIAKRKTVSTDGQRAKMREGRALSSPIATRRHREGSMDYERWVNQQMDLLKMKSLSTSWTLTGVPLPVRLAEKIFKVNVNGRNSRGETLMISVVRYLCDDLRQVQCLNILFRMGADPNLGDLKNNRTPIMYACLYKRIAAVRALLNQPNLLLEAKDRLGNNALMYAALQGDRTIVDLLTAQLAKSWSFNVFLDTNRRGKTAEAMAVSNEKDVCADLLRSTRVRMLHRMHKQLALIHYSAEIRGWKGYTAAYRAAKVWQTKKSRHRLGTSLPVLAGIDQAHMHRLTEQSVHKIDTALLNVGRTRAKSCEPVIK